MAENPHRPNLMLKESCNLILTQPYKVTQHYNTETCALEPCEFCMHPLCISILQGFSGVHFCTSVSVISSLLCQDKWCCNSLTSLYVSQSTAVLTDYCSWELSGSVCCIWLQRSLHSMRKSIWRIVYFPRAETPFLTHQYSYIRGCVASLNLASNLVSSCNNNMRVI